MAIERKGRPLRHAAHSLRSIAGDSDVVVLALVTAQALEAQGEAREAAQWMRRAADQARKDGNDERSAVFARAAVDLASGFRPALLPFSSTALPRRSTPASPRRSTSHAAEARSERAIRRASPASLRETRVFAAQPWEARQSSWESTLEAMLVLMAAAG
jgi:hypothetical protein